jgi:hypothetical protein
MISRQPFDPAQVYIHPSMALTVKLSADMAWTVTLSQGNLHCSDIM